MDFKLKMSTLKMLLFCLDNGVHFSSLFVDENDCTLRNPVKIRPETTLSYFYNQSKQRKNIKKSNMWLYEEFSLVCDRDVIRPDRDHKFENILNHIFKMSNNNHSKVVFATMSTDDMNIRAQIIPDDYIDRFSVLSVYYSRHGGESSRGFLKYITSLIPINFNIWKLYNHTTFSTDKDESGRAVFILENQTSGRKSKEELIKEAKDIAILINDSAMPRALNQIKRDPANIIPITDSMVRKNFKTYETEKNEFQYDVFLSYSSKDESDALLIRKKFDEEGIKSFFASDDLKVGDIWPNKIRNALINSMEFCILYTQNSANSSWVKKESIAAWVLIKKIVPILKDLSLNEFKKDTDINVIHAVELHKIEDYIRDLKVRIELLLRESLKDLL